MRATAIIWHGAGSPAPHEGDLSPIPPRKDLASACAMCGDPGPRWLYKDAFGDNFRPVDAFDRMFPFAAEGAPLSLCAACAWCAKALRLRTACFFARADGVWFVPRRHLLAHLLNPPEPPFVACAPIYGADHGGEAHGWRAVWPGEPPLPDGTEILRRLQAKHVAAYARVATSRESYPLQWDDSVSVTVDVALWRTLAADLGAVAALLRAGSVGVTDCRDALRTLRCPHRAPLAVHRDWPRLSAPLRPHAKAPWWPLIADLVPLPEAPPWVGRAAKTPKPAPTPPPKPAADAPRQLRLL